MKHILFLLAFGLARISYAQTNAAQKADALLEAYCRLGKFTGTALIARGDSILLEKGYGLSHVKTKLPNSSQSIFQAYSITKTFTSTVILKLMEEGKLSLSDTLSKFYPGFPNGGRITIEHLLTHTSGIYDYTRGGSMSDRTEDSFMRFLAERPLDFPPGTQWSYSNSGYWILGFIIAKLTGIPYEEAVRKFIFEPLQMTHSGFNFKTFVNENKTTGYEVLSRQAEKEAIVLDPPDPYAAGAMYSTVSDLLKFHKGLQDFSILKAETLTKAYEPCRNNYGLGWIIGEHDGKKMVAHSGGGPGFRTNLVRIPAENICIVLLSNVETTNVEFLSKTILDILYSKPYKLPFETKVSTHVLQRYTGTYKVPALKMTLYVTIEDGRLKAQPSGQPATMMLAENKNHFHAVDANMYVEFAKGTGRTYDTIVMHGRGRTVKGQRIFPSWGVVGSATPGGWNGPDIPLIMKPRQPGLWIRKKVKLNGGEIKFRFNNDWLMNYGDNEGDSIPDPEGKGIAVAPGTYNIVLNLTRDGKPRYRIY